MDDLELIKKVGQGDRRAFELLVRTYQKNVYGLALRILGSAMLAEEVAQETWLRVITAAPTFEPRGSVKSWILTITKNQSLNVIQKRGWEDALPSDAEEKIASQEQQLEFQMEFEQNLERLKVAVSRLPERQRVALVLWMHEEKSYSELSQELGINVNAVKVLLFRAKENIQKFMREEGT